MSNLKLMMMRNIYKFMMLIALGAMTLASCEEDKFTEKDAMDALQHIDVALTVQDGSSYGDAVDGATVQLVKDSVTVEKTTDGSGNVVFSDMKVGGDISVYVNKDNYTKAMFQISTSTDSYRTKQISKTLKIYPLSGDNLATVKGKLSIETDLTNREREKLAGREVRVVNPNLGSNVESSFVGVTDSEGQYSVKVPVNPDGSDNLQITFPTVDTTQTLAMQSGGSYQVVSKPAVYYPENYDASDIPGIPSATVTVDAPNDVGSGFDLGAKVEESRLSQHSAVELIQEGSGYEQDTIPFSEGVNNVSAELVVHVNNSPGPIQWLEILDNGAYYTSEPTIDLSGLSGSGAIVDVRFETTYLVYIASQGSGYQNIPTLAATYQEYSNGKIVEEIDEDLNNNNELKPGWGNDFNQYVKLYDGAIYPDNALQADTLFRTKGLAGNPELSISTTTGQQAIMKIHDSDISSSDSTIFDWYFEQSGRGYDPGNPPTITVSSIGGYGSGARFAVEVDNDGTFESGDVVMKDNGTGYVRNVNDFEGSGWTGAHGGDDYSLPGGKTIPDVSPGDVKIKNLYYGTGARQQ